jgi:hypothetical protein
VRTGAYLVQRSKIGDAPHAADPASVGNGGADIINELLFNQLFAIPDAIKDFAHGNQVRTGSHGPSDLSPVCMAAALHFDLWVPNFGVQVVRI